MPSATRILIMGNSGSGKTTYARHLAERHGVPHLDLDSIVWEPDQIAVRRAPEDIRGALDTYLANHSNWVIEGCYGELIEAASRAATQLIFMNPGLEVCLAHNRKRPWEPHKYASAAEQDAMLEVLQTWVAEYYTRDDDWSYLAHRRIYDTFAGPRIEYRSQPEEIADLGEEIVPLAPQRPKAE